jgi:S1-C subfamily serine protease
MTGPCGAGVLLEGGLILTCKHVINVALRLPEATKEKPIDTVTVDFSFINPKQPFQCEIVYWDHDTKIDLAGLKLSAEQTLPEQVVPAKLVEKEKLQGEAIQAFGFPKNHPNGTYADGIIKGPVTDGLMEISGTKTIGYFIQPGFSGGPVWDLNHGGCLGIITKADLVEARRVAYMVPASLIHERLKAFSKDGLGIGIDPWTYIDKIKSPFFRAIEKRIAMNQGTYPIKKPVLVDQVTTQNYLAIMYMGQEKHDIRQIGKEVASFAEKLLRLGLLSPLEGRLDEILENIKQHINSDADLLSIAYDANNDDYLVRSAQSSLESIMTAMEQISYARMTGNRSEAIVWVHKLGDFLRLAADCFDDLYDELEEYLPHP